MGFNQDYLWEDFHRKVSWDMRAALRAHPPYGTDEERIFEAWWGIVYQLSVARWHRQGRGPLGEPTKRALINAMDRLVNEFRYGHLGLKDLLVRSPSTSDTPLLKNIAQAQSVQPTGEKSEVGSVLLDGRLRFAQTSVMRGSASMRRRSKEREQVELESTGANKRRSLSRAKRHQPHLQLLLSSSLSSSRPSSIRSPSSTSYCASHQTPQTHASRISSSNLLSLSLSRSRDSIRRSSSAAVGGLGVELVEEEEGV